MYVCRMVAIVAHANYQFLSFHFPYKQPLVIVRIMKQRKK